MSRHSTFHFLLSALNLLLLAATTQAQKPISDPSPPNTSRLYPNLYIDKTEVANFQWLEFVNAVRQDSGLAYYQRMLPDSTLLDVSRAVTISVSGKAIIIDTLTVTTNNYLRIHETRYYPIVASPMTG